jgi:hypothetical protein
VSDYPTGHIYDWREVDRWASAARRPVFSSSAPPEVRGSGSGAVALLYQSLERVAGAYPVRHQTVGDCVSQGFAGAVDIVRAVEIDLLGERERWTTETASEPIYSYSRIEHGGNKIRGDGSIGAWGAVAVSEGGTVDRRRYPEAGIDLSTYSGSRARNWGSRGTPDALEPLMREHPIRSTSLVTSYEDARDSIANGYPVVVCSNQGFATKRDADGFAKPRGSWGHCMLFCGVDDEHHHRPGLLCVNSWGADWINGPTRHDQPPGSFWVDADVANRMLRRNQDSYAVSGFEGYPARALNFLLI